jgi:hypothetical protein
LVQQILQNITRPLCGFIGQVGGNLGLHDLQWHVGGIDWLSLRRNKAHAVPALVCQPTNGPLCSLSGCCLHGLEVLAQHAVRAL